MSVTARGRGVVRVARDTAALHLALELPAAAAADALAGAQSAQAEAMEVLLRHVEERQVSSEGLQLNPDYRHGEAEGFIASHTLRVGGLGLDQATALIAVLATELGDRLRLHGLEVSAADTSAAEVEARELAMADARSRAEHLAGLAGASLGAVLAIADSADVQVRQTGWVAQSAKLRDGSVQGGEADVEQSVTVTWALA
ncbi:hypothetical protein BH11ACT8_BH11ACT8_19800 [soil metagenome]